MSRALLAAAGALLAAGLAWLAARLSGPAPRPERASRLDPVIRQRSQLAISRALTRHAATRARPGGILYWLSVILLAAAAAAGVMAVVLLAVGGPEPRARWAYPAAALGLLFSTALGAPALAFATRVTRGHWAIPLRRAAELFGLAGLVAAPLHVLLLFQLPDWRSRPSIWMDWPGAPLLWDAAATVLFALVGLALLYAGLLPDLAARRDHDRFGLVARLALGWIGTGRQWRILTRALVLLGALHLILFVLVHLLVASDLALSLVPGWHSSAFPAFHAISALQGGVAATILAVALLSATGRLEENAVPSLLDAAGKLLLALSALFFYLLWTEFLVYWYGRTPVERDLLALLMFGPYLRHFVLSLLLSFLLPLLILIWHRARRSLVGSATAAALVLVGMLFDRVRIYAAAWSVAGPVRERIGDIPAPLYPGILDLLVLIGAPASVVLLYLLALRFVPGVSIWERRADHLLRLERPYLRTTVSVVAKPS